MNLRAFWNLLREAFAGWTEHGIPRLAAALSFYTVFSMAPLLVLVIAVAGAIFGREAAQGEIVNQLRGLMGRAGAEAVQSIIESARQPGRGLIAGAVSVAVLLIGATGVFGQLQEGLNIIWHVRKKPGRGVWGVIRDRFASFAMVMGIAFLLLVSLVIHAALAAASRHLVGTSVLLAFRLLNHVIALAVVMLLFALIFKLLPDAKIRWRDTWIGAGLTAALFAVGKSLLGVYLGTGALGSTFGAAGSLVVILVWVYYSSQIMLFGAELTRVYAHARGAPILPASDAAVVAHET